MKMRLLPLGFLAVIAAALVAGLLAVGRSSEAAFPDDCGILFVSDRAANDEVLGLMIAHKLGVMQTNQDLPFPPSSVVQAGGTVIGAIAIPRHDMVSWAGGPVHLAWIAEYEPAPDPTYHVLYYGQVDCSVVDR